MTGPARRTLLDQANEGAVRVLSDCLGLSRGDAVAIFWDESTAACVAGGNPDLHIRIPNLAGFRKDEVIIPKHSRNVYDSAVRVVGSRKRDCRPPCEGRQSDGESIGRWSTA